MRKKIEKNTEKTLSAAPACEPGQSYKNSEIERAGGKNALDKPVDFVGRQKIEGQKGFDGIKTDVVTGHAPI